MALRVVNFKNGNALRRALATSSSGDSLIFVLPNPSGRNAHYSYAEMLDAFKGLRRLLQTKHDRVFGLARRLARGAGSARRGRKGSGGPDDRHSRAMPASSSGATAAFNCEDSQPRLGSKDCGGCRKEPRRFILIRKKANATQARQREHTIVPEHAGWPLRRTPFRRTTP